MKVTSINQSIHSTDDPSAVRVEGSFILLSYGLTDVYYNDQGREVFSVVNDPVPVPTPTPSWWKRIWLKLVNRLKYESTLTHNDSYKE